MVRQVAKSYLLALIVRLKKCKRGLLPELVLFRLVAPPLPPGVVGFYPVRGIWFPILLPLEGTGRIQNFGL
jgi:hypothetical protein